MTLDLYPYLILKQNRNKIIAEQWIFREQLRKQILTGSLVNPAIPELEPSTPPISGLTRPIYPDGHPSPPIYIVQPLKRPPLYDVNLMLCYLCPLCETCLDNAQKAHNDEFDRRWNRIKALESQFAAQAAKCIAAFIGDVGAGGANYLKMLESLLEAVYPVLKNIGDDFGPLQPYLSPTFETLWGILTQNSAECISGCATSGTIPLPTWPLTQEQKDLLEKCGAACYTRSGDGLFPADFDWNDTQQLENLLYKFLYNETLGGKGNGLSVQGGWKVLIKILMLLGGSGGVALAAQTCWDASYKAWQQEKARLERELLTGPPYPAFNDWDLYNRQRHCINFVLPACDLDTSSGSDTE